MKKDYWILKAFLLTFVIALFFNAVSNVITNKFDNIIVLLFNIGWIPVTSIVKVISESKYKNLKLYIWLFEQSLE